MSVTCCRECVAPKRYPGCHDHCPDYAAEKAESEKAKAAKRMDKYVHSGITSQKFDGVRRAMRRHGRK